MSKAAIIPIKNKDPRLLIIVRLDDFLERCGCTLFCLARFLTSTDSCLASLLDLASVGSFFLDSSETSAVGFEAILTSSTIKGF